MPSKSPRVFSRDFKLTLCREIQSGQKRPAQACREHQLTESVLLRWRHEYEQRGETAFTLKDTTVQDTQEQKIAELERYCGQLSLENSLLKKALARGPRENATS